MMRVVYRTRIFRNLRLATKWYQAEIGLRRLGGLTVWKTLRRMWKQRTRAEEYGRAVVDRYVSLKEVE